MEFCFQIQKPSNGKNYKMGVEISFHPISSSTHQKGFVALNKNQDVPEK